MTSDPPLAIVTCPPGCTKTVAAEGVVGGDVEGSECGGGTEGGAPGGGGAEGGTGGGGAEGGQKLRLTQLL